MIRVLVGDLAAESVDAVVRPADAGLAPIGAEAVRLDEAGGHGFAAQRRTATPLETGAAVVTGGGDLAAAFAVHVIVADERGPGTREKIRRALVSAWQRAGDWGLLRLASPLVGVQAGSLTVAEAAELLVETFPDADEPAYELRIVVAPENLEAVEAIVRRRRA